MNSGPQDEVETPGPLIIVLGAPPNPDGSPSTALRRRAACAVACFRRHPGAWLLASGGAVLHPVPEARVLDDLLQQCGVPAERILCDECSCNTWENARRCADLVRHHGFSELTLVTDPLHLPRARLAFRAYGLDLASCPRCQHTSDISSRAWWRQAVHEALGLPIYLLRMLAKRATDAVRGDH